MNKLKAVLMERDGITSREADDLIKGALDRLYDAAERGSLVDAEEIIEDEFGLEPDYLDDFLGELV